MILISLTFEKVELAESGGKQFSPIPPNHFVLTHVVPGYEVLFQFPSLDYCELPFDIDIACLLLNAFFKKAYCYASLCCFSKRTQTTDYLLLISVQKTGSVCALNLLNSDLFASFIL